MFAILPDTLEGKRTAWNVKRWTDAADKRVQVWVLQRKCDRPEAAHRNSDDGAVRPTRRDREPALHVGNEVLRDVVLVTVPRAFCRIYVIG